MIMLYINDMTDTDIKHLLRENRELLEKELGIILLGFLLVSDFFYDKNSSTLEIHTTRLTKMYLEKASNLEEILSRILMIQISNINVMYDKVMKSAEAGIINGNTTLKDNVVFCESGLLKQEYTFDEYLVDHTNEVAYLTCKRIAEESSIIKNRIPVYTIIGGAGLGKTHLVTAILNHFLSKKENKIAYFFNKSYWTKILKENAETKTISEIVSKIINAEYVIFDDLSFLEGIRRSFYITILYDILDGRINANKITVFTSILHPKDIVFTFDKLTDVGENSYFKKLDGNKYTFSEPFYSRLVSNVRLIDTPTLELKLSYFKRLLNMRLDLQFHLLDSDIQFFLKKIIKNMPDNFRIINNFCESLADNIEVFKNGLTYDTILNVMKLSCINIPDDITTTKINSNNIPDPIFYTINKVVEKLELDLEQLKETEKLKDKKLLIKRDVALNTLYHVYNCRNTHLAAYFAMSKSNITKSIKRVDSVLKGESDYYDIQDIKDLQKIIIGKEVFR